jgi:enoyl-CoA hydratase/carnithine racemase
MLPVLATASPDVRFVAHVCGTEADPQRLSTQIAALQQVGVTVMPTNAAAARLTEIAHELDADPQVRVVIIRGAGESAFSAGADIAEFETVRGTARQAAHYAAMVDGALDAIAAIGKPTLSLIRGFCIGGGLELASASKTTALARWTTSAWVMPA